MHLWENIPIGFKHTLSHIVYFYFDRDNQTAHDFLIEGKILFVFLEVT